MPSTPFRIGHVAAVKLSREEPRTRRLHPGEDEQLMLYAAGWLRDLIIGALESGCREGELLSLQWHQVRFSPRAELFLPAQKTKAKRTAGFRSQHAPGGPGARRRDPAGEPLPATAFVFGDEIGRRRGSFRTAWYNTVLKAHGHTPTFIKTNLSPTSRAALKAIGLHFHDLRREAGSRWMDAGVPLATIQRWLGHANIAQTSTYLGASLGADDRDMRVYEERIGRVPSPLTYIDKFSGLNGPQGTSTDPARIEKTQQNPIGPEPDPVLH